MVQQPSPRKRHGWPGFISWPRIVPLTQPSQQAVQVPHCRAACVMETGLMATTAPQQRLYFLPLPQGQGSVLPSIAHRGSKVLVSLAALQLGANSFMVGVLAALYAVFPLLLAVYAGRISDRVGVRYPI